MIVIKLGGSLCRSTDLTEYLAAVENFYRRQTVVVVPGGGDFADQVRRQQRRLGFDDETAHRMAILAMQQTALMFCGLQSSWSLLRTLDQWPQVKQHHRVNVWMPQLDDLDCSEIQANWDVTSDSLAAWLAVKLQAEELVLVKAAPIDSGYSVDRLQSLGILDQAFHAYVDKVPLPISVVNVQQFSCHRY